MTREEAKELFKKASDIAGNYLEHVEIVSMHNIDIVLSEIYNDHEAQLKAKEETLVLEKDTNNCDTCKWSEYCGRDENCKNSKYLEDRYEPKDNK